MIGRLSLPSLRRAIVMVLLASVAALVMLGGPAGTTASEPAEAIGLDFCPGFLKNEDAPPAQGYRGGVEAMTPTALDGASTTKSVTAYEQFGSTGLQWSRYDKDCSVFGPAKNMIGNTFLSFATAFNSITIGMYTLATDPKIMDPFMEPIDCLVKGCRGSKGLDDALYLNFLTPVIVLGALWAGWTGLVKKSTTQAWQGGLWMIMSAAFALFFMANPTGIASTANSIVSSGNAITAQAITGATSATTPKADICYLPQGVKNYGPRVSSCSLWKAMSWSPWATGQFGVPETVSLPDKKVGNKCQFNGRQWQDMRITQLCAQSVTRTEARVPDAALTGVGVSLSGKVAEDKADIWDGIKDQMGENSSWAGVDPGNRINIAFASLIAAMAAGLIILIISFSSLVLALGMILLVMAAPAFLLAGVHPGVGRGIALKWLEMLLSTVVKRLILGFMLALLVGMYQIIITTDMSTIGKIVLIMAVGVAAMIYRKPMLEAFNIVNLGGSQTGMEQGGAQAAQKAGNMGAGAAVGGASAALAGGGIGAIIGSTVTGMGASRAGMNPAVQASRMAGADGSRRGKKSAEAREERRRSRGGEDMPIGNESPAPDEGGRGGPGNGGAPPRPGTPHPCPHCNMPMSMTPARDAFICVNPACPGRNGPGGDGPDGDGGGNGGGTTPRPDGGPQPAGGPTPTGAPQPAGAPTPAGGPLPGGPQALPPSGAPTPTPAGGSPRPDLPQEPAGPTQPGPQASSGLPTRPSGSGTGNTPPTRPTGEQSNTPNAPSTPEPNLDLARQTAQRYQGGTGGGSNPPPPAGR